MPNQNYLLLAQLIKHIANSSGNSISDNATFLEKVMNQLGLSGTGNTGGGSATTDASQLIAGTLPDARLSTNVAFKTDITPATTDASQLTTGILPDVRLSGNVAFKTDVNTAVANLVNASPAALDTLKELATALGNDPNFATTITNALAGKVNATDIVNALTQTATGKVLDASQGKVLNDLITALQGTVTTNTNNITTLQGKVSSGTTLRKDFGLLIPAFKTVNKFDNISGTLSATQLAIHSSGTGLISATGGTNADGYLKLPAEIEARNATRTDWLVAWDTTESTASITLGIGDAATGYMITIANTGGNVVVTFPSGAAVTGALTGTVNLSVSIATGNMGITCSVHVLGTPAALATNNPYRVPVFEYVKNVKTRLWHSYFKSNTTTSKIVGFLHNMKNWNGDPTGQLLTRTMLINAAGWTGLGGGSTLFLSEHDNMIIIPERTNTTTPLKVAHFFHGRTLTYKSIIDTTIADNAETGRQLLAAGYAIIATTGGAGNTNVEADYWGNPTGLGRASEVYDVLQNNITNVGKEYLIGWSMGGISASNYTRMNPDRVAAVWLCCPVLDLEETGNASAIQINTTLKSSLDAAYMNWYYSLVASNTADPQTDGGTNWKQVSDPGCLPSIGIRNYTVTTVASAQTNQSTIPLTSGTRFYPGDYVFFKWSGQLRQVVYQGTGVPNSIALDAQVTVAASEPVSLIRPDGKVGYDFVWCNRPITEWSAGTFGQNVYVRRKSAHPELDVRPYNPTRFADFYAEISVPFHIMVGGDGTSTGNDGILNNSQMFAFASAVNAIKAGVVTMIAGSGGHISAGNLSYSDTLSLFNAN
jgi:pimeloyl-ACP methyl ester carboxylesterase